MSTSSSTGSNSSNIAQQFKCDVCSEMLLSMNALDLHRKSVHNIDSSSVPKTKQPQPDVQLLPHPLPYVEYPRPLKNYEDQPSLPCPECPRKFKKVQEREQHMDSVHKEQRKRRHANIDLNTAPKD
ncbi:Zinc finger C2H2-type [Sesbania bispinosa]|nr:Zinc finger C2H2-type [Sesbania bispinosa]